MSEPQGADLGRIWLVDDNAEFRTSAVWWLESLGYALEAFGEPQACIDAAAASTAAGSKRACLLLDVRMPQMTGLQLFDALRARGVTWPVIFMTGHGDVPLAVEAMRKGALTFLEKPFQETALEEALARAFPQPGEAVGSVGAPEREHGDSQTAFTTRVSSLTAREREVMGLVVEGHPNKVVAHLLGISPKTVELHRAKVMSKMGARSLTRLVRMNLSGCVDDVA